MKINKKVYLIACLILSILVLSACGFGRKKNKQEAEPTPSAVVTLVTPVPTASVVTTPAATQPPVVTPTPVVTTPVGVPTPAASQAPAATPTPTPAATPAPTPAPTPIPTAAPTPVQSNLPRVTKSPTSETVAVNGKCQFVAKYENAKWAEWHFVSPDGTRDITYLDAAKEFSTLKIINGYAKDMTLENIPEALNGWKVYCRFSNDSGAVKTEQATITVMGTGAAATGAGSPKVTKSPTGETVKTGGAATFVANYENAIWAEWHFVSPDDTRDLLYSAAKAEFPTLTITGGDQRILKLSNIPATLNGWKVYCTFRNNIGAVNTAQAAITVQDQGQGQGQGAVVPATQRAGLEGRWAEEIAGRCQIDFTYAGEGSVNADISWSSSAWERARWKMKADVYRNDIFVYEDGHYWVETYSDNGNPVVSQESFGGTGSFYLQNGKLHWYNEQTGTDTVFIPA